MPQQSTVESFPFPMREEIRRAHWLLGILLSTMLSLPNGVRCFFVARKSSCAYVSTSHRLTSTASRSIGNNKGITCRPTLFRLYSASTNVMASSPSLSFDITPLGSEGKDQLDGLDVFQVEGLDGHPLSVYGIESKELPADPEDRKHPILLLHGRTWSAVPVYHLMGGSKLKQKETGQEFQSRSLMESLLARNLQPYCMDFRGFGGTHHDESGFVEPLQCVQDTEVVLEWIMDRHYGADKGKKKHDRPSLLGWSQGALVAQLTAQKSAYLMSKLILYGSIYDPTVRFPREPLYATMKQNVTRISNTFDDAIEDFTIEGSIPPEPARKFAHAALQSDPQKAVWKHMYQFNNCDPGRVHIPTMVIAGDQDPYAPLHVQQDLFYNLGRGSDRTWSILSNSDHAVHLLQGRKRFISLVASFCLNGKRSESDDENDDYY